MRRVALLVAALVVVGAGVPLATATASFGATPSTDGAAVQKANGAATVQDESGNNSTAPGAKLASVVNVQGAEVQGDLAQRSFGIRLAAANSNSSRASVLARQAGDLSARLAELQERKRALVEAKQNGSISQARFRAEMAGLVADISTVNELINRTSGEAEELPDGVLASQGVNAEQLTQLREAAGNLTGSAVSTIARNVSGPSVNVSVAVPGNITVDVPGNGTVDVPGNAPVDGPGGTEEDGEQADADLNETDTDGDETTLDEADTDLNETDTDDVESVVTTAVSTLTNATDDLLENTTVTTPDDTLSVLPPSVATA